MPLGFVLSKRDYLLFTKWHNSIFIAALVYVGDVLITGNDGHGISALKQALHEAFTIQNFGLARYFLGMEICISEKRIMISKSIQWISLLAWGPLSASPFLSDHLQTLNSPQTKIL